METNIFLEKLQQALGEETTLTVDTKFADLSLFDSMSIMILIAFVDENFNRKISALQFKEMRSVNDLMKIIGEDYFV